MKLVLCRSNAIGSWFLRTVMWSKYSHSAMLDETMGLVYDTTLLQGGVKCHTVEDFFAHYPDHELRDIDIDEDKARIWLKAQVGKPYDWTALVSWVVRRNWQEDDSWFCSEHTETCISTCGKPRFREGASRISPRHQEMLA